MTTAPKGEVANIHICDLEFPGGLSLDVTPLDDNDRMPIIVVETNSGYRLIDGFGRASGMENAGRETIRAIIVTAADAAERTTTGDDEDWNKAMYARYTPALTYSASTN